MFCSYNIRTDFGLDNVLAANWTYEHLHAIGGGEGAMITRVFGLY